LDTLRSLFGHSSVSQERRRLRERLQKDRKIPQNPKIQTLLILIEIVNNEDLTLISFFVNNEDLTLISFYLNFLIRMGPKTKN